MTDKGCRSSTPPRESLGLRRSPSRNRQCRPHIAGGLGLEDFHSNHGHPQSAELHVPVGPYGGAGSMCRTHAVRARISVNVANYIDNAPEMY